MRDPITNSLCRSSVLVGLCLLLLGCDSVSSVQLEIHPPARAEIDITGADVDLVVELVKRATPGYEGTDVKSTDAAENVILMRSSPDNYFPIQVGARKFPNKVVVDIWVFHGGITPPVEFSEIAEHLTQVLTQEFEGRVRRTDGKGWPE